MQHSAICRPQKWAKIIDFGCGSGRLAVHVSREFDISYLGLDVVQQLLNYAKTKTPKHYEYLLNRKLSIPSSNESVDWFAAFSVFTHLLHSESFIYLHDMYSCLIPGGKVVASFLEFEHMLHWHVFEATVNQQRNSTTPHLNQFIERNQFRVWASNIGFSGVEFIDGNAAPWSSGHALGQSIVIFTK
ncbi:class I SAM-dependent methyltransferase [Methylobacterium sp. E-041]|uniref:class I SAM-dependent methyltransferase n=1 Tax=Methylobacterium sp. E-041 TaxID=2836573 RepID=UPI001FB9EC8A|nr:class I SAM-dependent methyltransferase [Methylobacterium sp. E-041]MCJ2108916.1 class I SAM-dependent methyltransferase [Methylobacterium sp. E-041]